MLPDVRVYAAADYRALPGLPEFNPNSLTEESRARRRTYQRAEEREGARRNAGMSRAEFLAQSGACLTLRPANDSDLPRILELLQRTHQLNATGVVHGPEEVAAWLHDETYRVFVAEMSDRYVDYGRIGVAACRREGETWELVSFLLSCRVLSRGISGFVLAWVERQAALAGARVFRCRYRENDRNRRMAALYRLAGLKLEAERADGIEIFSGAPPAPARPPRWLDVREGVRA
jgi:FkbH-like protein